MWEQRPDRRRMLALGAAAALAGGTVRAAEVRRVTSTHLPPSGEDASYVPPTDLKVVADIYRRMTAPVMVNGQGPFAFVVDTGANQSVITDVLAARLGLAAGDSTPLNGVAGVKFAPTTTADVQVGDRTFAKATMSILPAEPLGGDGLLGLDLMEGQRLTLDFRGQSLRIESGRSDVRPTDVQIRARRRDGQLTLVEADLAGVPVTAFLDSGAQATIGNMALRQLAVTRNPTTVWSRIPIVSATGQTIEADIADLPALHIGGIRLPNWPVAFADLHTFRLWDLVSRPAILVGVDVMSRFEQVSLDFRRNEVSFRFPT
ncbi:MAG TPA: retroviral-like aspartic protease family protein [Caulobacteraceae bacterium]|nr:retroviral-like aspartic protease family protein [Caulobacteraceae bacterium]